MRGKILFGMIGLTLASFAARADEFILSGGPIHSGLGSAEAVVIRGEKISFVGALDEARRQAPKARRIDLKGAAAFPGFIDAHGHLSQIGLRQMTLSLEGTASLRDLQHALATYVRQHAEGPIIGSGWIETHWPEKRFPTRQDLDAVEAKRPVWLRRADGHAGIANSAALTLGAVTRDTRDPEAGRIERDTKGEPTGMLIDGAMALVTTHLPEPTLATERAAILLGAKLYAERGWTGIEAMSVPERDVEIEFDLAKRGALPIRVDNYIVPEDSARVLSSGPYADDTGLVHVRGVKLYADGALGSRGAALLAPYGDAPGSGLVMTSDAQYDEILGRAKAAQAQVAVHAIGDRGNRIVLDAYERAFAGMDGSKLRWRIEHAQTIDPTDLPRFAKLGVIASMQPSHAISDLYFAPARLGDARLKEAYPWNSLLASGAVIAAGTDAPVEKGDPLIEFYAAVYRHSLDGFAGENWHLEETVSRDQALKMLTYAPAFATFRESELGTLEAGKRADVTVFSIDLMTAPVAEIPKARAVLTIVNGKIVHQAQ